MFKAYTDPYAVMEGTLLFSPSHIVSLGITATLILLLFLMRHKPAAKIYGRWTIFICLLVSEAWLNYWYITTNMWDVRETLPFQLCSISLLLCMWMLVTKQKWSFEVTYFLGLGGALQAVLTPELFYDFPHFRFIHFFIAHIAIILAVLYMLWVEKQKTHFKSLWKAFGFLQLIAVAVFIINKQTGGNYMFLARKPFNESLIDFLGPYPWYILSLEVVVLAIFLILYLPFFIADTLQKNKKQVQN